MLAKPKKKQVNNTNEITLDNQNNINAESYIFNIKYSLLYLLVIKFKYFLIFNFRFYNKKINYNNNKLFFLITFNNMLK